LQERGYRIGFSPAGFVWHYRRSTVKAYLRQQAGYGEAEALLEEKHPEYFNVLGGGIWHGRIYAAGLSGILLQRPVIYHGVFGSGFFQKLYAREPSFALMYCTSLQFQLLFTLPLCLLAVWVTALWPVAAAACLVSGGVCVAAGTQASLPPDRRRFWSRPLVSLLFFLQPLVRGWARYKGRFAVMQNKVETIQVSPEVMPASGQVCFWSRQGTERYAFLEAIQRQLERLGWPHRVDSGWSDFDMEIATNRWATARLTTVHEELAQGRKFFRCRIATRSSWWSRLLVGTLAAACFAAIILLRETQPMVWFALGAIPVALLVIAGERGTYEHRIAALIANVARDIRLELWNGKTAND
jgi:hypothetical protein